MDKAKSFMSNNWQWLLTSIFLVGLNFGIAQTQLASKVNKEEAREIAKEEIKSVMQYYFSETEGAVMQTELKNIKAQLNRIEKKLDQKGKIASGTGAAGIVIALIINFGTISNELQEWWYMAKGEKVNPSSLKNISEDKFADNPDYYIANSTGERQIPDKQK